MEWLLTALQCKWSTYSWWQLGIFRVHPHPYTRSYSKQIKNVNIMEHPQFLFTLKIISYSPMDHHECVWIWGLHFVFVSHLKFSRIWELLWFRCPFILDNQVYFRTRCLYNYAWYVWLYWVTVHTFCTRYLDNHARYVWLHWVLWR